MDQSWQVGTHLNEVELGSVAHGGHFVARVDGRVVFVRHGLPGELVDVRITELSRRFARADVVKVLRPSPHRISPACAIAGECGGCDFQHIAPSHTRTLKAQVIAEQLLGLAGIRLEIEVEEVPPAPFGWRTRMRYQFDESGRSGLHAHRSSRVVPLPTSGCLIAAPEIAKPVGDGVGSLLGVSAASGTFFLADGEDHQVSEVVGERTFAVSGRGFWQSHRNAPQVLVNQVVAWLDPQVGDTALDLYCGVGLFAGALVDAGARVWGVEGNRTAAETARSNVPEARFLAGDVARKLPKLPGRVDLVVLDPPRTGAGTQVLGAIASRRPRAIVYVACDPAALARDLKTLEGLGYGLAGIRAFDLFPNTHHVETVAKLTRLPL